MEFVGQVDTCGERLIDGVALERRRLHALIGLGIQQHRRFVQGSKLGHRVEVPN